MHIDEADFAGIGSSCRRVLVEHGSRGTRDLNLDGQQDLSILWSAQRHQIILGSVQLGLRPLDPIWFLKLEESFNRSSLDQMISQSGSESDVNALPRPDMFYQAGLDYYVQAKRYFPVNQIRFPKPVFQKLKRAGRMDM